MKQIIIILTSISITVFGQNYQIQKLTEGGYSYEIVTNDPTNTRIYTLSNGLKVYLSVYKNTPRIQTYIAVRAGSKNDPVNTTGLAHYLEHIVFKGTSKIGTSNWEKEKPLLAQIETQYETYRTLKDTTARTKMYAKIDSTSGEAAKYAIANEYDKIVSLLGAKGTNAYTWVEQTVYVNDIPSNEIERWTKLEAERFSEVTPRLFHTELEAVYEEKNRGLDNDMNKVIEKTFASLYPNHQYGSQTTIGTIEHLQNPSITEIKKYFYTYYVPNNMAICMSGDLDPTSTIRTIDQFWGNKLSKNIPIYTPYKETDITNPIEKTVYGPSQEMLFMGYRFPGAASKDALTMEMFSRVLSNGKAGLMDLNLVQTQKVLGVSAFPYRMKDYSGLFISANPREGQSLEEVKNLVLAQIDSIKQGKFKESLLKAIINNEKIAMMRGLESNDARADYMVDAFVKDINWSEYVAGLDAMAALTKKDIVDLANQYFGQNYVAVYKKTGKDTSIIKVKKPKITPVSVNRESQSDFLSKISKELPIKLEPVFLNFDRDMETWNLKEGIDIWYKKNEENKLFEMQYRFPFGKNQFPKMELAIGYLNYLGTPKMSSAAFKTKFYELGCDYSISISDDKIVINLTGLAENMEAATNLLKSLLANPKADEKALKEMVKGILKARTDAKLDKATILRAGLGNFAKFGANNPFTNILTEKDLKTTTSQNLISLIKTLKNYQHQIWYYGPEELQKLSANLTLWHSTAEILKKAPAKKTYKETDFSQNEVLFVHYDMVQAEMVFLSKSIPYDKNINATASLYNEYFGGSMNSIVFQEIRESKALAYGCSSNYRISGDLDYSNYNSSYIGTQADKMTEAIPAMLNLLENMPKSDLSFSNAKEAKLNEYRSDRITKMGVLASKEYIEKMKLINDPRPEDFSKLQNMNFSDIENFQKNYIKGKPFKMLVVGHKDKVDFKTLEKIGKVKILELKDIFGY